MERCKGAVLKVRSLYRTPALAIPLSGVLWIIVLVWVWEVMPLGGSANALNWFTLRP